ncbi:MAG TPA: phosphatidylserine decarboxylase [Virgibacillus sp.]|nr:phosphatidylserine decarboxylase [Virgibacillus sp.]
MLHFLLKSLVELTGNPFISKILRKSTYSRFSKPLVKPFARVYGLDEHEMANPIDHYRSIHELFTRQLLPGLRPIDTSAHTLVSPVDGTLSEVGTIQEGQTFYVKNQLYHVNQLLGDTKKATTYTDGYYYIFYLSPKDYHHMHYPIDGKLTSRWALGEKSFPVNSFGLKWGDYPLSTNYRIISEIKTAFGNMAIAKIGALNINSIQMTHAASSFKKGEEIGYFTFGSTVILLIEKHPSFKPTIDTDSTVAFGERIGMWF